MSGDEGDKAKAGGGDGGGGGEYGTFQGPPSYPPPRPPVVGYPQPVQPPGLVGQRYSRNRGGYHSGTGNFQILPPISGSWVGEADAVEKYNLEICLLGVGRSCKCRSEFGVHVVKWWDRNWVCKWWDRNYCCEITGWVESGARFLGRLHFLVSNSDCSD